MQRFRFGARIIEAMMTLGRYLSVVLPVAALCACYGTKGDRHLLPEFEKPASAEIYHDSKDKRPLPVKKTPVGEGEAVSVRVMFMGEVDSQDIIPADGTPKKKVFMGRKATGGDAGEEEFEPFYFTIDTNNLDHIYKFKRGDIVEVRGIAGKFRKVGRKGLHVIAHEIKKVPPLSAK